MRESEEDVWDVGGKWAIGRKHDSRPIGFNIGGDSWI